MRRMLVAGLSVAVLAGIGVAAAPDAAATAWWSHVKVLADDRMRGRETGSPEDLAKAEAYVVEQLRKGRPATGRCGGGYYQTVKFQSRQIVESASSAALVRDGTGRADRGSATTSTSARASISRRRLEAPLVFVGYGLSVPERAVRRPGGSRPRGQGRRRAQRLARERFPAPSPPTTRRRRSAGRRSASRRRRRHRHRPEPEAMDVPWCARDARATAPSDGPGRRRRSTKATARSCR